VADQEITTEKYEHLSDVRDAYPNATLVFLDAAGSEDLAAFIHPEGDTIYVVGTDSDGLGEHLVPGEEDDVVRVSASIELWSHMALAIALYDRQSKAV
jgi:tRNA(Leu) C34 or U34 (ribose-2'-O)-methylase TrmL